MSENKCGLCGEPMQPGEEMFKFHGSMGDCPKPPLGVKASETRQEYRELTEAEKGQIASIKHSGEEMIRFIDGIKSAREFALAKTKIEEAVMWAVKGITG